MSKPESISNRQQQYIEVIDDLARREGEVRTKTLADRLGVRMPSVTESVHRMVASGLLRRDSRNGIRLTRNGRAVADQLQDRHTVLRQFMTDVLGMEDCIADEEACRIEHATRGDFVKRLAALTRALSQGQLKTCRRALARWQEEQIAKQ